MHYYLKILLLIFIISVQSFGLTGIVQDSSFNPIENVKIPFALIDTTL